MSSQDITTIFAIQGNVDSSFEKLKRSYATLLDQTESLKKILLVSENKHEKTAEGLADLSRELEIPTDCFAADSDFVVNLSSALTQIQTSYFLLVLTNQGPVYLRRSCLTHFSLTAARHPEAGYFYGDYDLVGPSGRRTEVHLLPFHVGRVRDNLDLGQAFFIRTETVRQTDGLDPTYKSGYLYDLRLKISEIAEMVMIGNRYAGSLYTVEAPKEKHNVFDYLMSAKEIQIEMEGILTAHLKRIGAYLPPTKYPGTVTYEAEEETRFAECIASVVTPVNNRPEFIGTAIESVQKQTIKSIEMIVVVNGGAEDPTIDVVKSYQSGGSRYDPDLPSIRLVVHDINNIGLCLNSALAQARGKYYVQLDSDDRLKPDAIKKILEVFDSDSQIGMVIGSYEVWEKDDQGLFFRREEIPVVTHDEWTEENGRNNLLRINGAGAPRAAHIKVLNEMGWFSMNDVPYSLNYGEDYEMVMKISERYRIGRVWEPVYEVVRHSGGTDHAIDQGTIDRNDNAKDMMRLEAIKRRKGSKKD